LRTYRGFSIDTAGNNIAYEQSSSKQSLSNLLVSEVNNSSASASTIKELAGCIGSAELGAGANNTGDITCDHLLGMSGIISIGADTGTTVAATNGYGQYIAGVETTGSGTVSVTNYYGVYVHDQGKSSITNPYAFYSEDPDYLSAVGKLESYREKVNALSFSSSITVDASLAPVHTVTLGGNTDFQVTNLGTGQTITLIITSDSTGSYSATFGTDTSTAVKFAGGSPTLTAAGGSIDVITIFNDGTNILGNFAGDFKVS